MSNSKAKALEIMKENIDRRFAYHRTTRDQAKRHETIKAECKQMALELVAMCPLSTELHNALKSLDEVMFWASASIARWEQQ